MGGMFGSGTQGSGAPTAVAIQVQSSAYGMALPIVWGCNRVPINLIWYGAFSSHGGGSGGKGGGGKGQSQTSYSASVAMGICEGPIVGIGDIWVDQSLYQPNVTLAHNLEVDGESGTVSGGKYTVAYAGAWVSDIQVLDQSFNPVTTYTVAAGVYTFTGVPDGTTLLFYYAYLVPSTSVSAMQQLGFELFNGSSPQSPWGYLASNYPSQALNYAGVAYIAEPNYSLGQTATLGNHNVEVLGNLQYAPGILDASPAAVTTDFLTNAQYGCNFPSSKIGDLTQFNNFCVSAGYFISPAMTSQNQASDTLQSWLDALNCVAVYSENLLKIIPRADAELSGNGATYIPMLTAVYDLTDDDFIGDADDPIQVTRKQPADAYNQFQVEFLNRSNQYNVQIAEAKDQAQIDLHGLRPNSPVAMHFVCEQSTAQNMAQVMMQRSLYVRNTYTFKLGWQYILLEPMDIVTITDTGMVLNKFPVRITKIEEDNDGALSITAEELAIGTAVAPRYQSQVPAGYSAGANDEPGNVNDPIIFVAPYQISGGALEAWMAISGGDSWGGCDVWVSTDRETYSLVGTQTGPARQGNLTASIDSYPTSVLSVALDNANLQLLSGSTRDADNLVTICFADGELLAYTTATLTGPGDYNLTGLVRGAYGTIASSHSAITDFARLDSSIFKYTFQPQLIGQTIYVKLLSFNTFGNNKQSLDEVNPYTVSLSSPTPGDVTNLAHTVLNNLITLTWNAPSSTLPISNYKISVGATYSTSTQIGTSATTSATIPASTSGAQNYWIVPVDTSGQAGTPVSISATPESTAVGDAPADGNYYVRRNGAWEIMNVGS